jgi:D-alanyl-D-alanine carboxypeptidase (penicillin-binding protein 5/6)
MVNTNHLLGRYPGVDGIKTGYTENAMQALVSTASRDGRRVFVAVVRSEDRIADTIPLLDYYLDNFSRRQLAIPNNALNSRQLADGKAAALAPRPVPQLSLPSWQWPYVRPVLWLDEAVPDNLAAEMRLGFVGYYLGNRLLTEAPLYAR